MPGHDEALVLLHALKQLREACPRLKRANSWQGMDPPFSLACAQARHGLVRTACKANDN